MQKNFLAPAILSGLLLFLAGCTQPPSLPQPPVPGDAVFVEMTEQGFVPSKTSLHVGQTVVFHNAGLSDHWPASNIHPTHGIYPEFDSKKGISPLQSWSFTFTKPGIWRCHDHLFPEIACTVTVE